ncbi:M23 family metallopeptidase [Eubacterium sp.]|uniref:M23 family metallopeptidase n=1 Tax=Eubacterium sp. TaxID=142586 RepID=UPI0025B7B4E4|nr:M23 family metallopeptidase [Eubacterium sp.]
MSTSNSKNKDKNIKALFSVVCLCIVALGLIVYFSTTQKSKESTVNEPTTIVETTEVQHAVTAKETTTEATTKAQSTTKKQAKKELTMAKNKNNTPFKSYYKYPLTDAVSKGYSEELTYDKTMGDYRAHTAVDFSGALGDKVVAVNDGLVTKVYTDSMYGLCVEIDHGGKFVAKYCGLESATVKKGDFVDIGNTIGTLGKIPCESGDGVHLHFSAKYKGQTINPLNVMNKTE